MARRKAQKQKVILPPELPPEISEDDIEVSDEDEEFLRENRQYASFVETLDTHSINKHVTRAANVKEDALEALYERRLQKKSKIKEKEEGKKTIEVDAVDALPVKTLDGQIYYRTLSSSKESETGKEGDADEQDADGAVERLTKAERRAKLKKLKKEVKKQGKVSAKAQEEQAPQSAVLAEVKEDLTAEKAFESKKCKLAEIGMALLADPESNIKSLKEMLQICKDDDHNVAKLGLLSLLAVFKDIIPGYRIRLPTEKELEMKVSKEVKKMRYYESTLLSTYKAFLQRLMTLEKQSKYQHVVFRCICTLLDAVPHFNFNENLLVFVIKNIGSPDDAIRKLCCATVKSLFTNEGKHGGEATVEGVRLIADHVKVHNCQLHPDSIEVFMSLSFDENLVKSEEVDKESKVKDKKNKKRKTVEEPSQMQESDRKKGRREMMTKIRDEVAADYKAAAFTQDVMERRRRQTEILSKVFETYFRILRHAMHVTAASSEDNGDSVADTSGAYPLLTPCLNGLAKFSHLIDLDYIGDLMSYLKKLAGGGTASERSSEKCLSRLTVSERLQCCIVAFKVMKSNLDALNVDLQDFFVYLYNLMLEYRPGRDRGETLAEALRIMLCQDRQHDMQKAAAFVKRLATLCLCFGSAESMAALVTLRYLLQKNVKCRNLLENDAGGGSVSGSIAKYQPYAADPNLSGALASVLWELNLLSKHYHPAISTTASSISSMSTSNNQVHLSATSPEKAFTDYSIERESFNAKFETRKSIGKQKRGAGSSKLASTQATLNASTVDEDELKRSLSDRFKLLRDFKENERLRGELDSTNIALRLYEEYKQQKKQKTKKRPSIKNGTKQLKSVK